MVDRPTHLIMRGGLAVCRRVVEEALLRRTVPWSGASVHEVAQVVAAASSAGSGGPGDPSGRQARAGDHASSTGRHCRIPGAALHQGGSRIRQSAAAAGAAVRNGLSDHGRGAEYRDTAPAGVGRRRRSRQSPTPECCWPSAPAEPSATRDADQPRRATSCRPPIVGDRLDADPVRLRSQARRRPLARP
jgi:hypothetical protein